ncbi:hemicentin-1-like [Oreochromis aureus]|uniref:hemicentin-1-like n=1 Tax=Oreochromis aureus TaxID=47969 RepID=UPI001953CDE0|nr:hemicentin-1-like [Oreochromis aureus]
MFVLIWATLLFSSAEAAWGRQHCVGRYCVTLSERELTAQAGLCVVIPCSFTTADEFTPTHTVWYKCDASQHSCSDADIIFHSNKNTDKKAQAGFEGRVSRLEPDVSQKNCSIIINDLKESDSGSYQLRVTGELNGKQDGFTFIPRVTVSVKGLNQKPTVMIPTLTEGQQATLTCTAPGLCSGSVPEITWTWRGAGGTESYITGNSTAFKTESLTTFTQRHESTLTFNPSSENHNTNVTCKVHFIGKIMKEETSGLNVNYMKKVQITGITTVKEGDNLNLTCSVESFPPSLIVWSKLGSVTNLHNDTGSAKLAIQNVTTEDSGQYICTATHLDTTMTSYVNVAVTYKRKPQIIGNTTIREGDVLNLTCSVESFPPSLVMWSKPRSNPSHHNGTYTDLHNDTGSATVVIANVTTEQSGQYICTATHLDTTVTSYVNVTVTYTRKPQIIGNPTVKEGAVLNLTCSVESVPPSLVVWSKLGSNTNLHSDTGSAKLDVLNVTTEDSGQYICTATHLDTTVTSYVDVTVTYKRKPQIIGNTTVREGDVLNLTCSVESFPPSLVMWSKPTSNPSHHNGTYTDLHNDTGSATVLFPNVTTEQSGQYICTATHLDTTETSYVNVIVTYTRKPQIIGNATVKEGDVLNLTCSVESVPPSLVVWSKLGSNTNLHSDTGSAKLAILNVTTEDSGQYICTAKYMNNTLKDKFNITVIYKRKPQIIGNTTIREGDVLNLTCSVESFPPSLVMWSKPTSNPSHHNGTYTDLHNDTGSATVVIANVTTEQSGQYICTATHLDTTVTSYVNVTVTYTRKPQIIGNTTVKEGDVLNLTCSVESVPPSLVMWSKLGSNTNLHNDTGSATFIISNATAEHSGQYICTTNYMDYALKDKVNVAVIYKRKPLIIGNTTVKEGDILNLTCSVKSFPPSLIMWKKLNSTTNLQNGTYTVLTSDTGSATLVIQNVTAEHSGQYICTATHLDTTMTSYINVAVTYTRKPQISGNKTIKEGDDLTLTCSIESFPPSLIMWSKLTSVTNLHNDTGSATLVIPNATAEDSGQYICTAKYMSNTLKEKVNLTVIYKRKPQIIGTTTVKKGNALNLTCSAESFPPALIMWKKGSSNTNLLSGNYTDLHNGTGSSTLVIYNVTAEYSGQYVCTAKYLDTAITIHASVTVTWFSETQDGSGCVLQSEVLTCVCISEGFPLPTIKWPLLKNHTEYSVITTVSKHTVNSTVSVTVNKHSSSTVECVSNNGNGENRENLLIHQILPEKYEQSSNLRVGCLKVIIGILAAVLLSAVVCCFTKNWYRKNQKTSRNSDETLEMEKQQDDKLQQCQESSKEAREDEDGVC